MTALLIFSGFAALLVWLAGRKDAALDPRLTTLALAALVTFPLIAPWLPKIELLPESRIAEPGDGIPWMRILGVIWGAGAVIALGRLCRSALGILKWRAQSTLLELREGTEIRLLTGLRGPVAAGVFRKLVFVPESWDSWGSDFKEIVLDHELAHHRRRDPLRRWIAEIAIAVHWFNPLVRWMVRRLAVQCEFECDAAVIESGVMPENYARLLCDLAEDRSIRGPVLAMAERSGLESRVRRIMIPCVSPKSKWVRWMIGALVLGALLLAISGGKRVENFSKDEVETRWSAEAFPGE